MCEILLWTSSPTSPLPFLTHDINSLVHSLIDSFFEQILTVCTSVTEFHGAYSIEKKSDDEQLIMSLILFKYNMIMDTKNIKYSESVK